METVTKRVTDLHWGEAVSTINNFVNDYMTILEKDATLDLEQRKEKVDALEKAWQRILLG